MREFLGPKVKTRLRPELFSVYRAFGGSGRELRVLRRQRLPRVQASGWIELFGAGMVDPAVYGFVNYDAKRLSGFAFGLGVERLTHAANTASTTCSSFFRTTCASCGSSRDEQWRARMIRAALLSGQIRDESSLRLAQRVCGPVTLTPEDLRERLSLSGTAVEALEQTAGRAAARRRTDLNRADCLGHYGMAREVGGAVPPAAASR